MIKKVCTFPATALAAVFAACTFAGASAAGDPEDVEWTLMKPTNTGIPGEAVEFATFAPDGNLWVAARWPFWGEGGIGIHDFASDTWETYADWDSPIPSEFVNDIEFISAREAWLGTDNGLVHFDDGAFTIFNPSNSPLTESTIEQVALDSQGVLWINSGIALWRFDGTSWEDFRVGEEIPWDLPWDELEGLAIDAQDRVWVGSWTYNGAMVYDGVSWTLHLENSTGQLRGLEFDREDNLWARAGINNASPYSWWKYDGETVTEYSPDNTPLPENTVADIAIDDNGDVYVASWSGHFIRTTNGGDTWSLVGQVNAGQAYSIALPPDSDDVWVTSPGWVHQFHSSGVLIEVFNTYTTGLPGLGVVDGFTRDGNGNFWVATTDSGFSRFDGQRWKNLGRFNPNEPWGPNTYGAEGLTTDSQGRLWVTTSGIGMLDPIDGESISGDDFTLWNTANSNLGAGPYEVITIGQDGVVFAADGFSGVDMLIDGTWNLHWFVDGSHTRNWIESLDTDTSGNVWAVSSLQLHMHDGETWTTFDALTNTLSQMDVNVVKAGPDGTIWIGTDAGLVSFDGVSLGTVYNASNSPLAASEIQSIAFRDDGLMAVSAHDFGPTTPFPNGVAVIDGEIDNPDHWTVFTYENSPMRHYQLGEVEFDGNGDLWISTLTQGVAIAHTGSTEIIFVNGFE